MALMFWVTSLKCDGRKGGFEVGEMKRLGVVTSSFNTRTVGRCLQKKGECKCRYEKESLRQTAMR